MAKKEAFARACVELFSHLWARLELIAAEDCTHRARPNGAFDQCAETFRLELIVLLDACHATRWRMLLDGTQRRALEQSLNEVLGCLNARFEEAPLQAIENAQNCLLDAVLEHAGVLGSGHREQPAPRRALARLG
jgi:hypothetical protein